MNNTFDKTINSYLFIGLGNPGREYKFTRHSIGFMIIDALSNQLMIKITKVKSKALIGTGSYLENKIILAKPQTFMNLSGQSVASLVKFYKFPLEHTLIIHDDLDLPFGTLRLRPSGSSGGQKGIGSVIQTLGTDQIPRLRVGIGRPPGRMDPVNYVLQRFSSQEEDLLEDVIDRACKACLSTIDIGIDQTMTRFNQNYSENK
jgi:PTH1 family peptidyl-tRNA hydrolase